MSERPLYLDVDGTPVFGWFHSPREERGLAVLMCPPWGWDEVASYRARRRWATKLADAGAGVLRLDLPGTGDSGGDPREGDQVDGWVNTLRCASEWLAGQPGVERVAAIGLGLGGLLALRAIEVGAPVDELVLWSNYEQGRRFVRASRAFAGTQSARLAAGEHEADALPPGWLEVNGFVLREDTLASLSRLDAREMSTGSLRRALLLDQDGMAIDGGFVAHLEASGVDVVKGDGRGWADMVCHPERSVLTRSVTDEVDRWLASGTSVQIGRTPVKRGSSESACLHIDGERLVETAVEFDSPNGRLFAIATEPAASTFPADACAVFLNAGAVRRIGPNRMWVVAARRWAALGVPSLRVDLTGIGDGSGLETHPDGVESLYEPKRYAEIQATLDQALDLWPGRRLIVVGLCAGAYWTFRSAQEDPRVDVAVALNPGALVWHGDTAARHRARKLANVIDPAALRRFVRGEVRAEVLWSSLRGLVGVARAIPMRVRRKIRGAPTPANELRATLDRLDPAGPRIVLAFSAGEIVERDLIAHGIVDQLARWNQLEHRVLPGGDHTLRPVAAQAATLDLLADVASRRP
jgi:dienelactone hydrolase